MCRVLRMPALTLRHFADEQDLIRVASPQDLPEPEHLNFVPVRQSQKITDRPDPVILELRQQGSTSLPIDECRVLFNTDSPDNNPSHRHLHALPGRCPYIPLPGFSLTPHARCPGRTSGRRGIARNASTGCIECHCPSPDSSGGTRPVPTLGASKPEVYPPITSGEPPGLVSAAPPEGSGAGRAFTWPKTTRAAELRLVRLHRSLVRHADVDRQGDPAHGRRGRCPSWARPSSFPADSRRTLDRDDEGPWWAHNRD